MSRIYHVCRADEWEAALNFGFYSGSSQDIADGFIHFSSKDQVRQSVMKHRAGQDHLVMLCVDQNALGESLKWEASKKGELFPHVYGKVPLSAVRDVYPLQLSPDEEHIFPSDY